MTLLRERMAEDLRIRNYARRTVECYVSMMARFTREFGKPPGQLGPAELPSTFAQGCLGSNGVRPQIGATSFPSIGSPMWSRMRPRVAACFESAVANRICTPGRSTRTSSVAAVCKGEAIGDNPELTGGIRGCGSKGRRFEGRHVVLVTAHRPCFRCEQAQDIERSELRATPTPRVAANNVPASFIVTALTNTPRRARCLTTHRAPARVRSTTPSTVPMRSSSEARSEVWVFEPPFDRRIIVGQKRHLHRAVAGAFRGTGNPYTSIQSM